jgi:hypothetical protein
MDVKDVLVELQKILEVQQFINEELSHASGDEGRDGILIGIKICINELKKICQGTEWKNES